MLIEEGRFYRDRSGNVRGPSQRDHRDNIETGRHWLVGGTSHYDDGRCFQSSFTGVDLVEEVPSPAGDPINAPEHYTSHASGVQPIDIAEHMTFCLGNVVKYVMRFEKKGGLEDLRKAEFYIKREIARREKQA